MKRSWLWMAAFSGTFLLLGVLDLSKGEMLLGSGLLLCGAGSALLAEGDRRDERHGEGSVGEVHPWKVLGSLVAIVGVELLSMSVFGAG